MNPNTTATSVVTINNVRRLYRHLHGLHGAPESATANNAKDQIGTRIVAPELELAPATVHQ